MRTTNFPCSMQTGPNFDPQMERTIDVPDGLTVYKWLPNAVADEIRDDVGCCDEVPNTGKPYYTFMADLWTASDGWGEFLDYLEDCNITTPPSLIAFIDTMRKLIVRTGEQSAAREVYIEEMGRD